MLVRGFKAHTGSGGASPEDVCRYVALHLGISEASATDIMRAATLDDQKVPGPKE